MRHGFSARAMVLAGTALWCSFVGQQAAAQNARSNGNSSYTLIRTDPVSGGPRTIDITTSGGDIDLDLAAVNVDNQRQPHSDRHARGRGHRRQQHRRGLCHDHEPGGRRHRPRPDQRDRCAHYEWYDHRQRTSVGSTGIRTSSSAGGHD
jgi:hypothetical protein